jgi:superfamily II DNA or RNA helicase
MDTITIKKYNETHNKIICDSGIAQELSDYFTFFVPGYKFMPSYKNKMWDGKIRLFNTGNALLYGGLISYVQNFCQERDYEITYDGNFADDEFSVKEANDFISKLNLPKQFIPRDYQIDAFVHAIRKRRAMMLSPTASGKSFIIYLIMRYYASRTLIIVPTTSLVSQLATDFADYGFQSDKLVHRIFSGKDKQTDKPITITTWQSVYKMDKNYFKQFDVVIGDEAHLFKAKSLMSIMEKLSECKYRFGFTGTLDGTQTHRLVLEGLFGAVKKVTTTAELIQQKHLADFNIKAIILAYSDELKKIYSKALYQNEMDFLVRNPARNKFIKNLAISLEGNTLLLFQYVDKHGKVLYDLIKDSKDKEVYFISGEIDGEDREVIRKLVETKNNAIIVASYGTFSTGVNIKNLHNVIFASPSKSRVRNLQSIGRGLRKSETKVASTLYDIADDLTWKSSMNHTIRHFVERVKIYNEEKFEYKIYNVTLKD